MNHCSERTPGLAAFSSTGVGITNKEWDDSVKLVGETLAKFKVPEQEQKDLAALVLRLEKDIGERP
jgi:hypothetical protein